MILVIRISGIPEIPSTIEESLSRMRLRRKYSAVLIKETPENKRLLLAVRNYVAYGKISKETLQLLVEKRGKALEGKKIDIKKISEKISEDVNLSSLGLKPFFRLHPPIGGIKSKLHYPKGVLGDNKESINDLVRRML